MPSSRLVGNVGSEPEKVQGTKGGSITSFSLAVDGGRDPEGERRTSWVRVTCFGDLADMACEKIRKGMKLECVGYPWVDEFIDKAGDKRFNFKLTAFGFNTLEDKSVPLTADSAAAVAA